MLTRITFFLNYEVQNKFGRNWCKGKLVLFAENVIEVAEHCHYISVVQEYNNYSRQLWKSTSAHESNKYVTINENLSILCCSFHQGDEQFSVDSVYGVAVACVVVVVQSSSCLCSFVIIISNTLTTSDIDYMVIVGDSYNREYLVMMDLQSQLHFNNQKMLSKFW